jgi:uncharacterized membrane protein
MLWLGFIAKDFYQDRLGHLLGEVNWIAAIVFYLFFIVGIIFFAVFPALQAGSVLKALFVGMFLGLLTYATYDLTNLATLKDWPLTVTLVDMVWGMVLTGSVATVSFLIGRALFY